MSQKYNTHEFYTEFISLLTMQLSSKVKSAKDESDNRLPI